MKEAIRILLVDDQELVRHGLRRMLESDDDMEVVDDCTNAEEALSQTQILSPDIVLMDIQISGMSGIETTRHLKKSGLDFNGDIIILADSTHYQIEALQAGAAGYLLKKDLKCANLNRYIRQIYWNKQLSTDSDDSAEDAIELVVPPSTNASHLLSFMCRLEERLHDNDDNYACILHTVGSWERGTVITISLKPARLHNLMDKLDDMPGVEKVEDEPLASGSSFNFRRKFRALPRPGISPSKRVRITLKETGIQGIATALNQANRIELSQLDYPAADR